MRLTEALGYGSLQCMSAGFGLHLSRESNNGVRGSWVLTRLERGSTPHPHPMVIVSCIGVIAEVNGYYGL